MRKIAGSGVQMNKVGDWLYFTPEEVSARQIMEAVLAGEAEGAENVEIWEEIGVLEIALPSGHSVDFEAATIHPKDEITKAFAEEKGAKTVFLVTFLPEDYKEATEIMDKVIAKTGGFFCGDTEDFTPVYPEVL